jgi:hypothetical protein
VQKRGQEEECVAIEIDLEETYVYEFPAAAVTKYHKWGGINTRNVLCHGLGASNPRTRYCQSCFPLEIGKENLSGLLVVCS